MTEEYKDTKSIQKGLEEAFQKRYKSLNKGQKQAVDTLEGPVLVVAGPGTGKTTILTLRIANILRTTDTPPSGILAITYTDAGVKAMKEKLRSIIGSRADEVRIHTFHGFAASLIAEFKDHFVHISQSRQMTDIDAESLVRAVLSQEKFADLRSFGNPDFYISPILGGIRDSKKEAKSPENIREFALQEIKRIEEDPDSISTRGASKGELKADAKKKIEKCQKTALFADVYAEYESIKKAEKLIDFDDLIFELILALGRDELFLHMIQEKFLYILVDEHQDTNDSQNLIIKMIADFFPNPNVFIVGDEKQAIYRFQGASVKNFLSFEKRWPAMTTISLETNYRSHQHILDASFSMIEHNYAEGEHEKLRIKLDAGNGSTPRLVDVVQAGDVEAGEEYMVKELQRIVTDEPTKEVAIISKTNRDVERIIKLCQSHDIPVSAERSVNIFSHPIGLIFFSFIEFLADSTKTEALGRTLGAGLWHLDFSTSMSLLRQLRSGKETNLENTLPALVTIRKQLLIDSPIEFLLSAVEASGFLTTIASDVTFIEVWRAILGLAQYITRQQDIHDPHLLLEKLLEYKASAENKSVKVHVGTAEANIKVMTAHGSKGLEFDYVFIPYATEESWSSRARNSYFIFPFDAVAEEGDEVRDIRRLFYVALTRAKEHLTVMYPIEDAGGELLTPLRFIAELDQQSISQVLVEKKPASQKSATLGSSARGERQRASGFTAQEEAVLNYAKHTLQEYGLSVTALNHFLTCPSEFLYKSILKLPEGPHPSAEKGIAMHSACDLIWKSQDKSPKAIQAIIEETVQEKIGESFLQSYEKEIVQKELLEQAPYVAKSLAPHFMMSGEVHTEMWTETRYMTTIKDGEVSKDITIPLHGKLDAVLDTGSQVFVFDYKTRGKMSVNQIKGLTKTSDGNYFRQLVFYKLLLQDQSIYKNKDILPGLVFLTPDEKGQCTVESLVVEPTDIEKVKHDVHTLIEHVWTGKIVQDMCTSEGCEWCNFKKLLHI